MITYAMRKVFTVGQINAWEEVAHRVGKLSDRWGDELRCHEIVRALWSILPGDRWHAFDGKCGPVEHSWLVFAGDLHRLVIVDPYAPGCHPSVLLLDMLAASHYVRGDERKDINYDLVHQLQDEMLRR